jgi:hypothetical protein
MTPRHLRNLLALGSCALLVASCSDLAPLVGKPAPIVESETASPTGVSFARDIRPLMNRSVDDPSGRGCKACHDPRASVHIGTDLGGLDFTTLKSLREGGGTSGRNIIIPGKPDDSALVQKLRGTYAYGTRMPKNGPPFWSKAEIQLVVDWIAQGAKGRDDE